VLRSSNSASPPFQALLRETLKLLSR